MAGLSDYTNEDVLHLLQDCRGYISPTLSTHEEISTILGWCDCGYCIHVPVRPEAAGAEVERSP